MGACCSAEAVTNNGVAKTANPVAAEKSLEQVESAVPETPLADADAKRACFGAGCYWGTEKFFYHDFGKKNQTGSITDGQVGFMGPDEAIQNPTYAEVKAGYTSHIEVFEFEYNGGRAYYEALVRFFFQFHDPTTLKRQGNDIGTQYASVIYCYDQTQVDISTKVKAELQQLINAGKITCFEGKTVTTDIRRATKFYSAHKEHQDYLNVNPSGYCNHRIRFAEWPSLEAPQVEVQSSTIESAPTVEESTAVESAPVVGEPSSTVESSPLEQVSVSEPAAVVVEADSVEAPATVEETPKVEEVALESQAEGATEVVTEVAVEEPTQPAQVDTAGAETQVADTSEE